jgi:hypothetical protein
MKAKLIKTDVNYLLEDDKGVIIASTSTKEGNNKLSKQNCDEIFGVVDVEKLAKNEYLDGYDNTEICRTAFKDGFNKAIELYEILHPTEIEVEIEMICPHPKDSYRCGMWYGCDTECYHPNKIPYLDSEGYLILKK